MGDQDYPLTFLSDPREFLSIAGDHLAADPVIATVVATIAHRMSDEIAEGIDQPDADRQWWLVVRDVTGRIVSAGMRTAPSPPYPPYLMPMPTPAAVQLAHELHGRGETVGGINGALPAIRDFADAYAGLTGEQVSVRMHTRLFELGELVEPQGVPGRLRPAHDDDLELALGWFQAFGRDADEQAGRSAGAHDESGATYHDHDSMLRRIRAGRLWFWVDQDERRVHMTGANPPAFGVARVGPVYTPRESRRHGYAGAGVAAVSRLLQDEGDRVCLFTDQENPTSNKVYAMVGYRPVVDMANLRIGSPA